MKFLNIILIFLFIGCVEKSNYSVSDFERHPEIKVFLIDTIDFRATHYFDRAWLHFSYKSRNISIYKTVDSIDCIAKINNWQIEKISDNKRIYLKFIKSYPADNAVDTLYFNYDKNSNTCNFKWH